MRTANRNARNLLLLLPALFFLLPEPHAATANYGNQIFTPRNTTPGLTAAVADLQTTLGRITSTAFSVAVTESAPAQPAGGIIAAYAADATVPSPLRLRLQGKDRETFLLHSVTPERLWIIANHADGLTHGIYQYLDKLGCRWYFPNPHWELIPARKNITLELDSVHEPTFIARSFFGTGGFGPANPVDPKLEMRQRWNDWQRRNRFGEQLRTFGHVGHAFSMRFAKELQANPEYRAMVNGARGEYRAGLQVCVSNPEVMALFVQDRLDDLRQRVAKDPHSLTSRLVGVDPSDGGGYCQCENCTRIGNGSVSDQIFHVANTVARAVAAEFPGRGVSLMAYGHYADLPSFELEPNVHVRPVPYAFQRTGMSGDDLLRAWAEKIRRPGTEPIAPLGIYDYWNITDWGRNLPVFDFRHTPAERIRFWHSLGVRDVRFESTYSAGAIGLAHFLAVRLMWDPRTDTDALIEEFYLRCFGNAATPMRRLLERWAQGFILQQQELALSFRDLQEAHGLAAAQPDILNRINDYIQYLQFLRLWHEFERAREKSELRNNNARLLAELLWRIYPSAMVQPYRLWQLLASRFAPAAGLNEYLNPTKHENPEWAAIKSPEAGELTEWLESGVRDYPLLGFEPRSFTGKLRLLHKPKQTSDKLTQVYSSIHSTTFHLHISPEQKTLPLEFSVRNWIEGQAVRVTLFNAAEKQVFTQSFLAPSREVPAEWHRLELPTETPGIHRLEVFDQSNGFTIKFPDGQPLVFSSLLPLGWVRAYFYVPAGLRKLALLNPPRNVSATLYDPENGTIELKPEDGPLYVIDIPEGMDGRAWSLRRPGSSSPVRLLNTPQFFGLAAETVMIPADAAPPAIE